MKYCTRNPAIKKPEFGDPSSIVDINDNMDVIDGIICKSNYNSAVDPSASDDIGDGYSVGSHWWNITSHKLFVAESVATGAAVWRQVYPITDWINTPTLTFASADAPVYTVTCSGNYTGIISVGSRIKLTHSDVTKYFIVVKTSYSSPNTTLTLYGGTDYTLASGTISNPYYSTAKAPSGFPLDLTKWTVTVTDSTHREKTSSIADNTWYNLDTSAQIYVPIGAWRLSYMVYGSSSVTATPSWHNVRVCLSSTSNGCSDQLSLREHLVLTDYDNNVLGSAEIVAVVNTKTIYYVNIQCSSNTAITKLIYYNELYPMIIKAECAYL